MGQEKNNQANLKILDELAAAIGEEKVSGQDFDRIAYSRDWSPRSATNLELPDIVVLPKSTEDVAKIVKIANKHKMPVTPFAGGTGMGGGAVPVRKGIVIDTKGLSRVIEIDKKNYTLTCEAGITVEKLNEALRKEGLWWPHDPESKPASTVGAAIACDNDGTFGIKYGKLVDYLLDLKAVLGDGRIMRFGHRKAIVSSSGYKMHWLFIGSEGTLGVITEVTLRVFPLPETRRVEMFCFESMEKAIAAGVKVMQSGIVPEAMMINCPYRFKYYTQAYQQKHGRFPELEKGKEFAVGISFAGRKEIVDYNFEACEKVFREEGGQRVKEEEIADAWWVSKHLLSWEKNKWPNSQKAKKFAAADPALPIGEVGKMYEFFKKTATELNLEILGAAVYAGRPGISPSISFALYVDDRDEKQVEAFRKYTEVMSRKAVDVGGTMSSYIGDGPRLVGINRYEHGDSLDLMIALKKIFDPNGIMNPGKKFGS